MQPQGAGPGRRAAGFAYQPALDGVRGIAVTMVLLFHAGFAWLPGGYVGVSVFFTLSGYLITSLALAEHEATGRIDVGEFYARRMRRLMPASMACLAGVIALAGVGAFGDVAGLRRDLWGALLQVFNWVALAGGTSYEESVDAALGRLAPLDHYWSLAIEEQFYWVWPVVLATALPRLTSRAARVRSIVAVTACAALAAPLIARWWGPQAAYWATPARLAEIFAGAALAVVAREWSRRGWWAHDRRVAILGVVGLAAIVLAAVTWPPSGGPAAHGWLPVFALSSVVLIAGLQVESPLRRALSWRPLVALGAISYGVYLFHWPIYALVDATRVELPRPQLFAVRAALTLAVAAVSYRLLEAPIRRSAWTWRPVATMAVASGALIAVVITLVVHGAPTRYWEVPAAGPPPAPAPALLTVPETTTAPATPTAPTTAPVVTRPLAVAAPVAARTPRPSTTTIAPAPGRRRPVRILVVGDSTASATGTGLLQWARAHPELAEVWIEWSPACGFFRRGDVPARSPEFEQACEALHERLPATIERFRPDVAMLQMTVADLAARSIDSGPLVEPGDAAFDAAMAAEYAREVTALSDAGVTRVAWVNPPPPLSASHVEHWDALRRQIEAVAATAPQIVHPVDLAAWDAAHPGVGQRPDKLHYTPESALAVTEQFLGPRLLAIAAR